MKGLYWRPSMVPRLVLVVITILAIAAVSSVEIFKAKKRKPWYKEKFQAAHTMKNGMEVIKINRIRKFEPVDKAVDPADSGMIGIPQSPITSNFGNLLAKKSTINPNWAAVLVEMLKRAGLKEGDTVAMGLSGSFPSLNLAAHAAAGAMKLKVIAITSVSASTWGANIPSFTWLDMESLLHKEGLISTRSVAASYGGREDLALGRSKNGKEMLREAIVRNGYTPLEFETTRENIDERMAIYEKFSEGRLIAAYVNIGGGTVSVGSSAGKKMFQPGLNMKAPPGALSIDGVMTRFARRGVPVIHMVYIERLLKTYGLPESPQDMPSVGEGQIFIKITYNLWLTGANLAILILALLFLLRSDIGHRIFGSSKITQAPKHPEHMV